MLPNVKDFEDEGYDIEPGSYDFKSSDSEILGSTRSFLLFVLKDDYKNKKIIESNIVCDDWQSLDCLLVVRFYLNDYKNNFSIVSTRIDDDGNVKYIVTYNPNKSYSFMYMYTLFMNYVNDMYKRCVTVERKDDMRYDNLPYKYPNYRLFNLSEFMCVFEDDISDRGIVYREKIDNTKDGLYKLKNMLNTVDFDGDKRLYMNGLQNKLFKLSIVKKPRPKPEPKPKPEPEPKSEPIPIPVSEPKSKKSNIKNKSKVLKKIFKR
jgi:hypothetical protein